MKSIIFIITFISSMSLLFGQNSNKVDDGVDCACDTIFDSCSISCPDGTLPHCGSTWYGGCDCECTQTVGKISANLQNFGEFDLTKIEELRDYIMKEGKDLKDIDELIKSLSEKTDSKVYFSNSVEEYNENYFILLNLFQSLSMENQKKLFTKFS